MGREAVMRIAIIAMLSCMATLLVPVGASADEKHHKGCNTHACDKRVAKRLAIKRTHPMCNTWACVKRVNAARYKRFMQHMQKVVAPYKGWLSSTRQCESGHHGLYKLHTTGNGFWFAYQFTPGTWASVGGKINNGRPVGMTSLLPTPLEQDYRAVLVLHSQGAGAWPNCG